MQKYCIVSLIDECSLNSVFDAKEWPLHVSIAGRFVLKNNLHDLTNILDSSFQNFNSFEIKAIHKDNFGPSNNIPVTVMERNILIYDLHKKLSIILKDLGAIYDEPLYNNDGFSPHVTNSLDRYIAEGEFIKIDNISIIDMYPGNDISKRKLIHKVDLV